MLSVFKLVLLLHFLYSDYFFLLTKILDQLSRTTSHVLAQPFRDKIASINYTCTAFLLRRDSFLTSPSPLPTNIFIKSLLIKLTQAQCYKTIYRGKLPQKIVGLKIPR